MNLKKLQEIAESKGKLLLIENTQVLIKKENIEIFDKPQLIESNNGDKVSCRGILKNVPVSTYIENFNNRIYNRELWENVYKTRVAENTLSLDGHPEDDGKIIDICGVWKNLRLTENCPIADWHLIGNAGGVILEAVNLDAKIGVSTVGFGEFLEDNKTVNPKTFELLRLGDGVLDPSQSTYATKENLVNEEIDNKIEENSVFLNTKNTNNKDAILENNTIINNQEVKMKELEEIKNNTYTLNFKNNVRASIMEAKKNPNFIEGIKSLEIIEVGDNENLSNEINNAISELRNKLDEQKKDAESKVIEINEKLEELQAKYDVSCQSLEQIKENYNKARTIIEKAGLKEDQEETNNIIEENKKTSTQLKEIEKNKKKLEKEISLLKEKISVLKKLKEEKSLMFSDIKRLMKERSIMLSDIKRLILEANKIKEKNKNLLKKLGEQDEIGEEEEPFTFNYDEEEEMNIPEEEIMDESDEDEDEISTEEPIEEEDEMIDDDEDEISIEEPIEEEENEITISDDEEIVEEEMMDEPIEDEDEMMDEPIEEEDEITISDDEEEDEMIDDEEEEEEFEIEENLIEEQDEMIDEIQESFNKKLKKSKNNLKESFIKKEIKNLYMNECKKYPALKNIKNLILESNSIVEVVNKIDKFKESRKSKNDKPYQLKILKSNVRPTWLEGKL